MAHVLSWGKRNKDDDASECIPVAPLEEVPIVDIHNCRVPNDAAFLKYFTPKYMSSNGSKPRYMWPSREFSSRDSEPLPAYSVTGFGLLDACLHAYACNSILVLHPLDILLSLCYTYGNHRKKPISQNNEELKKITQIRLRRSFTRSHLVLVAVAKLARRVETYPLQMIFSLINTELNSPDPIVVRLAIGMLCYLAGTKETTRLTVEHMRCLFEMSESCEALLEPSIHNNWNIAPTGVLDVRHDPTLTVNRKPRSHAAMPQSGQSRATTGDPVEREAPVGEPDVFSTSAVEEWKPRRMGRDQDRGKSRDQLEFEDAGEAVAQLEATRTVASGAARTADLDTTNEMRVNGGEWRTMLDALYEPRPDAPNENSQELFISAGNEPNGPSEVVREFHGHQRNNANRSSSVREAEEWTPRKIAPSSIYRIKKENGIQSVKFIGNKRAWMELPEMMMELCQFFVVDRRVLNEIVEIGKTIRASRLGINQNYRKFWTNILFKNGQPKMLPDADYQIDGWLATLLGARLFIDQSGMNLRHLADMKTGVKLPVLLVRLPSKQSKDYDAGAAPAAALYLAISDDSILEGTDSAKQKTRLLFFDEYRDKLLNSSGNARESPVGLFMPWRSCEAVNQTRRLWRHVGGDSPAMSRSLNQMLLSPAAKNLNNTGRHTTVSHKSDLSSAADDELAVRMWTIKHRGNSNSRSCCGCRSKRLTVSQTEPAYNMCCLMSGICGFTVEPVNNPNSQPDLQAVAKQVYVRPICFFEIAFED